MARGLGGRYFSKYYTTAAGGDLLAQVKTSLGITGNLSVLKMTLVSPSKLTININGIGDSDMYLDADTRYKLSLDSDDCQVVSLVTAEIVANVFIAIIY